MSTDERNNEENKQKYKAMQRKNSVFRNTAGNGKQLEKRDNDVIDLISDKNDNDE